MERGARISLCAALSMLGAWVGGCASASLPPIEHEALTYETHSGPFCGRCDTTKITVTTEGAVWVEQGHWASGYRNWRATRRRLDVSPAALLRFNEALGRYLPEGNLILSDEACEEFWTDAPEIHVTWYERGQRTLLIYNFGCDPQTRRDMRNSLISAPQLLEAPDLQMPEFGSPRR